jgi:hypothetical protein
MLVHKQAAGTVAGGARRARAPRVRCVRVVAEAVSAPAAPDSTLSSSQRAEVERLEASGAAFQELVALNETKQSVNRPQKVGTLHL